jgi:hypothetical protein
MSRRSPLALDHSLRGDTSALSDWRPESQRSSLKQNLLIVLASLLITSLGLELAIRSYDLIRAHQGFFSDYRNEISKPVKK